MNEIGKYNFNNINKVYELDELDDYILKKDLNKIGKYQYNNKLNSFKETNNKLIIHIIVFLIIFVYIVNCCIRNHIRNQRRIYRVLLKKKKINNKPAKKLRLKHKYKKNIYFLVE